MSIATFELDDSSLLSLDLEGNGTLLVTEGSTPDGGKAQYAVSSASPPVDATWRVVTLRYEQLATKNRITLDLDGKTLTYDLTFPHSTVGIVRVGCRFAGADVTSTYAIDDVSIR